MNALAILIFLISFDALSTIAHPGGKVKAKCLKFVGMTKAQLREKSKPMIPDYQLKCYYRCILENHGFFANDTIVPGEFMKHMAPMLSNKTIEEVETRCHSEKVDPTHIISNCDAAAILYRCYSVLTKPDLNLWLKKNNTT